MKNLILALVVFANLSLTSALKAEIISEPVKLNSSFWLLGSTHYILQEMKLIQTKSLIKQQIKIGKAQVSIYPNPASDYIKIKTDDFNQYQLFDEKGVVYRKGWIDECETIERNTIPAGVYFLKLSSTMGDVYYHRVVLN